MERVMPPEAQGGLGQAWFVLDFEADWAGYAPTQDVAADGVASEETFGVPTIILGDAPAPPVPAPTAPTRPRSYGRIPHEPQPRRDRRRKTNPATVVKTSTSTILATSSTRVTTSRAAATLVRLRAVDQVATAKRTTPSILSIGSRSTVRAVVAATGGARLAPDSFAVRRRDGQELELLLLGLL